MEIDELDPNTEVIEKVETLDLDVILSGQNLALLLRDDVLSKIGSQVIRDVEIDEESRHDWLKVYKRSLDAAMQVRKAKTFPWPNASNIKYPLLTTACIQFQARAYPAIVDGSNLVKGRVLGPDPDGTKRARADRMGQHMTWQLLYRMPDWEEDTDKLLLMLPITGCVFRKTYYDQIEGANRSEMVSAEDFIVNYWAKSLKTAPRYTHVLRYYPYEITERIQGGQWREVKFSVNDDNANDENGLVDFYEQHRTINLDGDGYPEHYVVTCTKDGDIARLVPCFDAGDVRVQDLATQKVAALEDLIEAGTVANAGEIVKIERRQYFTKYSFIPAPDGSFYDIGFGSLLDDIGRAINSTTNQMLDAGALQNAQGGLIGNGVNMKGGNMVFRLGEWKRVDVTGGSLRDNVFPLNTPGPSAVLFNLLNMLIESAKEITAVQDVLTGQGTANQPATTTLALIEQGQKVMTGIFKRVHRAFGNELRILRMLNRDYLDDEEYFQLNDPQAETGPDGQPAVDESGNPIMQESASIGRADYEDRDLDVIPVSDPSQASDMMRMARSEAEWQSFNGDPMVNQMELRRRRMEVLGVRDVKALLVEPKAPPPDPKMILEMMKAELEKVRVGSEARAKDAQTANVLTQTSVLMQQLGLIDDASLFVGEAVDAGTNGGEPDADNGQGAIPGLEGQPSDAGVPAIPQGPAGGPDALMGAGPVDGTGDAGAGGLSGPDSGGLV